MGFPYNYKGGHHSGREVFDSMYELLLPVFCLAAVVGVCNPVLRVRSLTLQRGELEPVNVN